MTNPGSKSHRAAVVVIPPVSVWPQIQAIRKAHDKAYERWMPHINLLYPFYDGNPIFDNQSVQRMTQTLSDLKPFKIRFTKESFGCFNHGRSNTFWLSPCTEKIYEESDKNADSKTNKKHKKKSQPAVAWNLVKPPKETPKSTLEIFKPDKVSVGLGALADAQWKPGDKDQSNEYVANTKFVVPPTGLDSLRGAVWTYGEAHEEEKHVNPWSIPDDDDIIENDWQLSSRGKKKQTRSTERQTNLSESEDENDYDEEDGGSTMSEEIVAKEQISTEQSTLVKMLQKKLLLAFPECDDVCRDHDGSMRDFRPHLTLGQCSIKAEAKTKENFQKGFNDIEFVVDNIHIIRRKRDQPFEISRSIALGCGQLTSDG